jgi:hypothetical protein
MMLVVEQAAELRMAGFTWDQISDKLERSVDNVRKWPARYRSFWDEICARIRREQIDGAGDEARNVLRHLLRSDDEEVRKDAAKKLVDKADQIEKLRPAVPSTPQTDLVRIATFLEEMSHDQRRQLLERELARHARPLAPDPGSPDGGGSA